MRIHRSAKKMQQSVRRALRRLDHSRALDAQKSEHEALKDCAAKLCYVYDLLQSLEEDLEIVALPKSFLSWFEKKPS